MDDIIKWLPKISEEDKISIGNFLNGQNNSIGKKLLQKYADMLIPYSRYIRPNCSSSGIVFFYACLIYIMHFPNYGNYIEDIMLYNILYLLVDNFIDDVKLDPKIKEIGIQQMSQIIQKVTPDYYINEDLIIIKSCYDNLLFRNPDAQKYIIKLFQIELQSIIVQNDTSLSRDAYYNMACLKVIYTMEVLQNIVKSNIKIDNLGIIMQLIDDSLDVTEDMKDGINTIATYELHKEGNLDKLWLSIAKKIDELESEFTIFKIIYTFCLVYLPDRNPQCYSKNLLNNVKIHNLFEYCDINKLLINAIMNYLTVIYL